MVHHAEKPIKLIQNQSDPEDQLGLTLVEPDAEELTDTSESDSPEEGNGVPVTGLAR